MGQTHFLSIKRGAAVITKVMSSLKDPELCWWSGGHWILQKLSWKKCVLNYNLKERKEMMKQRKRVIQSKYLDWQRVSWSSEIWLLSWANTHPGRCSGLSFFLIITYNSQLGFPGGSDGKESAWKVRDLGLRVHDFDFLFVFIFTDFYWHIVALQCCISFYCTIKLIKL